MLLVLASVAVGCSEGSGATDSTAASEAKSTERGARVTAVLPPGWEATRRPVSNLLDPRQLLAVGSFDLNPGGGPPPSQGNCFPSGLLKLMPSDGALITVTRYSTLSERLLHRLPRRPDQLRLSSRSRGPHECGGKYDIQFREHGRGYIVDVWLEPGTVDSRTRRQAERVLRSLELPE